MNRLSTRALGTALGVAADRVLADPARFHPVAGFGACASALEKVLHPGPSTRGHRGSRVKGAVFTVVLVGGAAAVPASVQFLTRRHPALAVAGTALTVWACLGGTSLLAVGARQADLLERGDLEGSRELLPWLCGRDPGGLGGQDLARAVIESVAENSSDAVVATLFWAAVAGPTGAAAHRAANTLDAMVGHRSPRYVDFGWASARLDDLLGWPAARVAGLLTAALSPVVGGRPGAVLGTWRRDAPAHPSPNAGVIEAACAGALGVGLGGRTVYPYGVELRPVLGGGRAPLPADVRRAVRLMRSVHGAAALGATLAPVLLGMAGRRAVAAASAGDRPGPPAGHRGQLRSRSARR